jgi:hypothetical protein
MTTPHAFPATAFPAAEFPDPAAARAGANCEQGTAAWHGHRNKFLFTGSTSAALLGCSKFTSAADLVARWDGTAVRSVSLAMCRGSAREDHVSAIVRREGRVLADDEELHSVGIVALPRRYLLGGDDMDDANLEFVRRGFGISPDGVGVARADGTARWAMEIKAPNSGRYSASSRYDSAAHAYLEKNEQYAVQLWLEMLALDVPHAFFAVYWPNGWAVLRIARADLVEAPLEDVIGDGVVAPADAAGYTARGVYDPATRTWPGLPLLFCGGIARRFHAAYYARRAAGHTSERANFWEEALFESNDAVRLVRWVLARAKVAAVARRSRKIDRGGLPYYAQAFTHEMWLTALLRRRRPKRMADLKPHQFVLIDTRKARAADAVQHAVAALAAATGAPPLTAVPRELARIDRALLHVHFVRQTAPPQGRRAAKYRISTHVVPAAAGRHACTWYPFSSDRTIPFPAIVVATLLAPGGGLTADQTTLAAEGVPVALFGGRLTLTVEPKFGSVHRALAVAVEGAEGAEGAE